MLEKETYSRIESGFIEGLVGAVPNWADEWEDVSSRPDLIAAPDATRMQIVEKWIRGLVRSTLGIDSLEERDVFTNLAFSLVELGVGQIEWPRIAWKLLKGKGLVDDHTLNPFRPMRSTKIEQPKEAKIVSIFGRK